MSHYSPNFEYGAPTPPMTSMTIIGEAALDGYWDHDQIRMAAQQIINEHEAGFNQLVDNGRQQTKLLGLDVYRRHEVDESASIDYQRNFGQDNIHVDIRAKAIHRLLLRAGVSPPCMLVFYDDNHIAAFDMKALNRRVLRLRLKRQLKESNWSALSSDKGGTNNFSGGYMHIMQLKTGRKTSIALTPFYVVNDVIKVDNDNNNYFYSFLFQSKKDLTLGRKSSQIRNFLDAYLQFPWDLAPLINTDLIISPDGRHGVPATTCWGSSDQTDLKTAVVSTGGDLSGSSVAYGINNDGTRYFGIDAVASTPYSYKIVEALPGVPTSKDVPDPYGGGTDPKVTVSLISLDYQSASSGGTGTDHADYNYQPPLIGEKGHSVSLSLGIPLVTYAGLGTIQAKFSETSNWFYLDQGYDVTASFGDFSLSQNFTDGTSAPTNSYTAMPYAQQNVNGTSGTYVPWNRFDNIPADPPNFPLWRPNYIAAFNYSPGTFKIRFSMSFQNGVIGGQITSVFNDGGGAQPPFTWTPADVSGPGYKDYPWGPPSGGAPPSTATWTADSTQTADVMEAQWAYLFDFRSLFQHRLNKGWQLMGFPISWNTTDKMFIVETVNEYTETPTGQFVHVDNTWKINIYTPYQTYSYGPVSGWSQTVPDVGETTGGASGTVDHVFDGWLNLDNGKHRLQAFRVPDSGAKQENGPFLYVGDGRIAGKPPDMIEQIWLDGTEISQQLKTILGATKIQGILFDVWLNRIKRFK